MHEHANQWAFVWAALAFGVSGTVAMVAWSLIAMARAEQRRDATRRK